VQEYYRLPVRGDWFAATGRTNNASPVRYSSTHSRLFSSAIIELSVSIADSGGSLREKQLNLYLAVSAIAMYARMELMMNL
jgi:hypothetical protein